MTDPFVVEVVEVDNGFVVGRGMPGEYRRRQEWVARNVSELQELLGELATKHIGARDQKKKDCTCES